MTSEEAAALLEMMKQQQRERAAVPRLDSEAMAKCYVRILDNLREKGSGRARR
jgi:hypothetical protein